MSLTLLASPPEPIVSTGTSLTQEQKRLIRETFARIEPAADLVARLFYLKSIDFDPSLRAVFKAPTRAQRRKFMAAMKIVCLDFPAVERPFSLVRARESAQHGERKIHIVDPLLSVALKFAMRTRMHHTNELGPVWPVRTCWIPCAITLV